MRYIIRSLIYIAIIFLPINCYGDVVWIGGEGNWSDFNWWSRDTMSQVSLVGGEDIEIPNGIVYVDGNHYCNKVTLHNLGKLIIPDGSFLECSYLSSKNNSFIEVNGILFSPTIIVGNYLSGNGIMYVDELMIEKIQPPSTPWPNTYPTSSVPEPSIMLCMLVILVVICITRF